MTISDVLVDQGKETVSRFAEQYGKDKVHFVKCDVRNEDDVKALWDETVTFFGSEVDVMVNNAGVNHLPGWKICVDIDLIGVLNGTYLAFDKMSRAKGGKGGVIISTASLAGCVGSNELESSPYFIAKHAVVAMTKSLGTPKVYREHGIRLACICPSFTDTDIVTGDKQLHQKIKEKYDYELMPVSRIASAFVSLMKTDLNSSNGKALVVVPEVTDFYWPNHDLQMLKWLGLGGKLLKKAKPEVAIFTSRLQFVWLLITFLAFYFILRFGLCCAF